MDKIKLTNADISYIHNFLNYDNRKINKDWVNNSAIVNICVLYSSIIFSKDKIIYGLILTLINVLIILSLIYFNKKISHNKSNLHLYYGIYLCLLSISLSILTNFLLRIHLHKYIIIINIMMYCSIVLFALITFFYYKKRICTNYYKHKHYTPSVYISIIGAAVVLCTSLREIYDIDAYLLLGICTGILSIVLASSVYFLIKGYCYYLIDKQKIN